MAALWENSPDVKEIDFNKPVIVSEFGGRALQGVHGSEVRTSAGPKSTMPIYMSKI